MGAIYKRELKAYFTGMMGYVFIAFILLIFGIYTTAYHLNYGYPNFELTISSINFIFLIAVPILTMRVFAEERKQKTDQLLYSLPIRVTDVVLGKYFALVTLLLIPLAIVSAYPVLILRTYGATSLKTAYSSIIGFFTMGCTLLAVGLFMSSLTENQIIAAVLCFGTLILSYFMKAIQDLVSSTALASLIAFTVVAVVLCIIVRLMTKNWTAAIAAGVVVEVPLYILYSWKPALLEGVFSSGLGALAVFDRLDNFVNGMFDVTALVYFISIALLFVFFTVQSVEKRRWS